MAKKTFTSGIDALLSPTMKNSSPEPDHKHQDNKLTSVMFRMPVSLKIEMEHYCVDNRIKQQELITNAIRNYIEKDGK
jgi:hypothetical protein